MVRMRFGIFWKGLLLIAVPVLFELTALALLFGAQRETMEAERWAMHSKDVIQQAETVRRVTIRVRDRVYYPESVPAQFSGEDLQSEARKLVALVQADAPQHERAKRLADLADQVVRWASGVTRGDDEGEHLVQQVRTLAEDFIQHERVVDAQRLARLAETRRKQQTSLLVTGVVSVVVATVAVWIFGQNVGRRLDVLSENARRLADGRQLLPRVAGRDEIAELDGVLHATADQLAAAQRKEDAHQQQLEAQAEELARTNEGLRQQTQENEMFVYSVSHDLRSPLVNLQGFSKELDASMGDLRRLVKDPAMPPALARQLQAVIDSDVTESLKYIRTAVTRSSSIIDALLRLSRAGRVEYRPQPLDMTVIVHRVADALWATAREKGATVIVNELPQAMGDPTAIEQVFGNLLGNALNYMDPARVGRVEVLALDDSPPGSVTFAVRDNGRGIPSIALPKVFLAFQRFHGNVAKGEGIGLALVRRVIERHEGRVRVESVEGEGTTFFVTLPAVQPPPPPPRPSSPQPSANSNTGANGEAAPAETPKKIETAEARQT
jgi:signal transduction histidine kinase